MFNVKQILFIARQINTDLTHYLVYQSQIKKKRQISLITHQKNVVSQHPLHGKTSHTEAECNSFIYMYMYQNRMHVNTIPCTSTRVLQGNFSTVEFLGDGTVYQITFTVVKV